MKQNSLSLAYTTRNTDLFIADDHRNVKLEFNLFSKWGFLCSLMYNCCQIIKKKKSKKPFKKVGAQGASPSSNSFNLLMPVVTNI